MHKFNSFIKQHTLLFLISVLVLLPAFVVSAQAQPEGIPASYQMIAENNFSPGNVGLVLPADIIIPAVGIIFLWRSYKHPKPGSENQSLR